MLQHLGSLVKPCKATATKRQRSAIYDYKVKPMSSFKELEDDDDESEQLNFDLSDMRDSLLPGQLPPGLGQVARQAAASDNAPTP